MCNSQKTLFKSLPRTIQPLIHLHSVRSEFHRARSAKSWIVANKFQLSIHSPRDSCLVLQYELNEHSRAIALIRFEQQWRMDQWNILKKTSAIEFIEFSLNWKNVHWIKHTKTIYANEHFCEITARKLQLIRGYQCDLMEAIVELYQEF